VSDNLARLKAALADRYRIERELGQGGMATVYLAHDLRHDRYVAIKVLRPELSAVIGAERFLREIKTIANLQHPHILGLIDSGEVQGTAYYVMPFVEGESLRDRLNREKQLPVEDAVRVATEVAAALDYAHRHGVIHRDIKPENILLHDGSAVVADFGIALAVSTAGGNRMTETGMSLGTPHYMSPEQAMGERDIDQRSDTFSLGCVLYEMLLGEPPFTGVTAQAVVAKIMTADAPSLTRQRRSVPPAIDKAVHRALERLPADRFDTTADFAAALKASSSQPILRSRRPIVLAGLVLVLLAIAAAGYLWKVRSRGGAAESDNRRVVAILPMRNISQDTAQQYFSEGMTEEITSQLAKVASLRVLGRAATAQYDTVFNRLKRMSSELGVGSVVDGSVRLAGDRVRINVELTDVATGQSLWSEQYERQMSDLFAVQADVAHQVANALQATLTESEAKRIAHAPTTSTAAYEIYLRASDLRPQTRSENRLQAGLLRQAIEIDTGFALAYAYLARNYMFRGVAGDPAWLDSGLVAARKAIAVDSELSDGYFALGDLQSYRFQLADARRSYLKALELKPSHDGVMADLANVYVSLGRYDEALDWSLRSAQLNPNKVHAPYHVGLALIGLDDDSVTARYLLAAERKRPTELRVQGLLSWLELRMGNTEAALARARRMIANDPDNTEGPPILAELAALAGLKEAEPLLGRLVAADPGTPSQYDAAGLRSFYALTLHQRGAEREASSLWGQSAAAAQQQLKAGAEGPAAPMELAAINAIQGHTAEAMDWLEQGYRAGWRDAHQLALDPFFASIRQEPRYKAVLANMRREVAEMRKRAADAHPELFQGPPHE
jgi:TolB-like protein